MTTVTGLSGFEGMVMSVRFGEGVRVVPGAAVTGNQFEVLGIQPWLGRLVGGVLDRVDPNAPTSGENRLSALTGLSLLPVSAAGELVGVIGLMTLALAAIGITGVLLHLGASARPRSCRTVRRGIRWA